MNKTRSTHVWTGDDAESVYLIEDFEDSIQPIGIRLDDDPVATHWFSPEEALKFGEAVQALSLAHAGRAG